MLLLLFFFVSIQLIKKLYPKDNELLKLKNINISYLSFTPQFLYIFFIANF